MTDVLAVSGSLRRGGVAAPVTNPGDETDGVGGRDPRPSTHGSRAPRCYAPGLLDASNKRV